MIPKCKYCGKPSIKDECRTCKFRRLREIYYQHPGNTEHRLKWRREYYKKNRETIIKQTNETRRRRKERQGEDEYENKHNSKRESIQY